MIYKRENVRRAVERALLLDPTGDLDAAIAAVAQATGLAAETVRECLEKQEQPA